MKYLLLLYLWLLFIFLPMQLLAVEKSDYLDLSSFSLAGIRVLPVKERVKVLNFQLDALEPKGQKVKLSSYRNKVLVISFWTVWYPPSRAEMPAIESLYQDLKVHGLEWLAVNVGEDHNTVERYIKKYGYTFPILLDMQNSLAPRYGIQSFPATLIINKSGYIVALASGSIDWRNNDVLEAFKKLLVE